MWPLTGLMATWGYELLRKPETDIVPCRTPVRPRSPLPPGAESPLTTGTDEPKDTPKLVDLRIWMAVPASQKTYTEWSGPIATKAPLLPETIGRPPLGLNVAP